MNIEEYISSGILEAYALGDVSEKERAEVEANLLRYPKLREELARIEAAQEEFLIRSAVAPPRHAKEKLFAQLELQEGRMVKETKIVPLDNRRMLTWWKLATAASVSLAALATYYAIDYRSELNTTRQSLNDLIAQNQQIAQDYNNVNQRLDNIENTLKIIDNPSYKRVVLRGTEADKQALASVYWNEATSDVYLSVQNLRDISKDQQFQLWAIVDGKPVDAGVFSHTAELLKMKNIKNASAFAVTIEPAGGSVSPTLSSMQVIGTI